MAEQKRYRKVTPTWAKALSAQEVEMRRGIIHTREGAKPCAAGDYLAKDMFGYWPIARAAMQTYEQRGEPDNEGFFPYYATDIRIGVKRHDGDYDMWSENDPSNRWVVAGYKVEHGDYEEVTA